MRGALRARLRWLEERQRQVTFAHRLVTDPVRLDRRSEQLLQILTGVRVLANQLVGGGDLVADGGHCA